MANLKAFREWALSLGIPDCGALGACTAKEREIEMPDPNSLEQAALAFDYARPCRALLKSLVDKDPDWLLTIMKSTNEFPEYLLTYACEYIGAIGSREALDVLIIVLKHNAAIVREGVLMGLGTMMTIPQYHDEVVKLLKDVEANDPELLIRDMAKEMLE